MCPTGPRRSAHRAACGGARTHRARVPGHTCADREPLLTPPPAPDGATATAIRIGSLTPAAAVVAGCPRRAEIFRGGSTCRPRREQAPAGPWTARPGASERASGKMPPRAGGAPAVSGRVRGRRRQRVLRRDRLGASARAGESWARSEHVEGLRRQPCVAGGGLRLQHPASARKGVNSGPEPSGGGASRRARMMLMKAPRLMMHAPDLAPDKGLVRCARGLERSAMRAGQPRQLAEACDVQRAGKVTCLYAVADAAARTELDATSPPESAIHLEWLACPRNRWASLAVRAAEACACSAVACLTKQGPG
eukprot:scaffold154_cov373-Prasinococcus_capsulatus_cf.AAC.6